MKPLLFLALCAPALASQVTPTQQQLDSLLTSAFAEWGVEMPTNASVTLANIGPCRLDGSDMYLAIIDDTSETKTYTSTETVIYSREPNTEYNQTEENPVVEELPSGTRTETVHHYLIKVNGNCNWRDFPLDKVVLHEVGHILIDLNFHSADKASVMYYKPRPHSVITAEDRAMVAGRTEARK